MKKYSLRRDPKDRRDYKFKPPQLKSIPQRKDLSKKCSPVEDQGNLGSCTGNAFVGAMEYLDNLDGKYVNLSRLFVYWNERSLENTVDEDAGACLRDGAKVLAKYGVCTEELWPYDISAFRRKPTVAAFKDAVQRKLIKYMRVNQTETDLIATLAAGFPVVFGFEVFDYFESDKMARTGILQMPEKGQQSLGGHAVLLVGYDQRKRQFLVRNSWGPDWGKRGYFWMPFDYVLSKKLASDFWTIQKYSTF